MSRHSGIPRLQEEIMAVLRVRISTPSQLIAHLGCKRTSFHVAVSELERRCQIMASGHGPTRLLFYPSLLGSLNLEAPAVQIQRLESQVRGLEATIAELEQELQEHWTGLENSDDGMDDFYACVDEDDEDGVEDDTWWEDSGLLDCDGTLEVAHG